jgi:hypothetical protein
LIRESQSGARSSAYSKLPGGREKAGRMGRFVYIAYCVLVYSADYLQEDSNSAVETSSTPKTKDVTTTTRPLEGSKDAAIQPPPAPAGGNIEDTPDKKGPSKEAEVVTVLSEEDVHTLFSGAPQFSVGVKKGQLNPTASFPWDFSLKVRDVSDCPPLEHPAYSSATLHRHLPAPGNTEDRATSLLGYEVGVVEVPSMLSARGNEIGTIGFEHFLEDPIADSLSSGQDKGEGVEEDSDAHQNYELLQSSPERLGVRKFDLEHVAERLEELSGIYQGFEESINILSRQPPAELYTLLFSIFLTPPKFDATTEDPTGLKVQIEALTKVLNIKSVWFDFSDVEWRIRAGQTLWTEISDPSMSDRPVESQDKLSDRNILLLQLVLSCELLLRLEAVASLTTKEVKDTLHLTMEEIQSFRDIETTKTRWDLVLARRFLENVDAKCIVSSRVIPNQQPAPKRGFFSSPSPELQPTTRYDHVDIMFLPRKPSQQLSGLFHFAKAISWPDEDDFQKDLTEALRASEDTFSIPSPSIYATPLSTPRSGMSNRSSSYFDPTTRPQPSRVTSQRSIQLQPSSPPLSPSLTVPSPNGSPAGSSSSAPKALIGGWLTRTYLTGLILPGEAITHFLISTILENDVAAISTLGDSANLYGGFIYKGQSWFSKSCVVGRVLACLKGATECMGWIYLPYVPTGFEEGWIDVKSKTRRHKGNPRIKDGEAIEEDSSILVGAEMDQVQPTDFVLPRDSDEKPLSSMRLDNLQLDLASKGENVVEDSSPSFSASLIFSSSSIGSELGHLAVPLDFLVHFVSSFPCTTPPADKLLLITGRDEATTLNALPAHPLHTSQTYKIIPPATVLANTSAFPLKGAEQKDVLVLDARGEATLELLSRAWCSSKGEHALISRVGVTCLACSVREAKALAIKIVIRIE